MLPGAYHASDQFLTAADALELGTRVTALMEQLQRPLLAGARSATGYGVSFRLSNSAILLSPEGQVVAKYDKIHLVPFGEFVPLLRYFPFLKRFVPYKENLRAGSTETVFEPRLAGRPFRFGVLICYEDIFPYLSRQLAREHVDCLVNITNDGWFRDSPELDQHVIGSVFRAVETKLPVLRAANTGITSIISPRGEEVVRLSDQASGSDREVAGFLVRSVPLALGWRETWYSRWGDRPAQVWSAVAVVLLVLAAETAWRKGKTAKSDFFD
jgi:apolipoprotein N-acyltransferase